MPPNVSVGRKVAFGGKRGTLPISAISPGEGAAGPRVGCDFFRLEGGAAAAAWWQPQARVGDSDLLMGVRQGGQVAKLSTQRGPSPAEWQAELWLPSGPSITLCLS